MPNLRSRDQGDSPEVSAYLPIPGLWLDVTSVYHLVEAAGSTREDSVGANTLTEITGTLPNTDGHIDGACLEGEGTANRILRNEVGNGAIIAENQLSAPSFAISFWFLAATIPSTAETMLGQSILIGADIQFAVKLSTFGVALWASDGSGLESTPIFSSAFRPPTVDKWHHVAAWCDAGDLHVLYDGGVQQKSSLAAIAGTGATARPFSIMGDSDTFVAMPAGTLIDEVNVWADRAFRPGEVTYLWNNGNGRKYPR